MHSGIFSSLVNLTKLLAQMWASRVASHCANKSFIVVSQILQGEINLTICPKVHWINNLSLLSAIISVFFLFSWVFLVFPGLFHRFTSLLSLPTYFCHADHEMWYCLPFLYLTETSISSGAGPGELKYKHMLLPTQICH